MSLTNWVQTKTPGKLFIAGEYAILTPGKSAIIVAVDAFITCSIRLSSLKTSGKIQSSLFDKSLTYTRSHFDTPGLTINSDQLTQWRFILSAIEVAEQWLLEHDYTLINYDICYESQLIAPSGEKIGLGSSGAVTVATIKTILLFYGIEITPLRLFQLSAIAMIRNNETGSLGDIAASCFQGWILYTSVDRQWLRHAQQFHSLRQLVQQNWPGFSVTPLSVANNVRLLIGWTHSPASTDQMIAYTKKTTTLSTHSSFDTLLKKNDELIFQLKNALELGNVETIRNLIQQFLNGLITYAQSRSLPFLTPGLLQFLHIAQHYHFPAKPSGAGGGDCAIAFSDKSSDICNFITECHQRNIEILNLNVAYL